MTKEESPFGLSTRMNFLSEYFGNTFFGRHFVKSLTEPETTPPAFVERTRDPHEGFTAKRKERGENSHIQTD